MSVWASVDQLAEFVYRSGHVEVMRRRREWFERIRVYMALWWVPEGHVPSVQEAQERLAHLEAHGPSPLRVHVQAANAPDQSPEGGARCTAPQALRSAAQPESMISASELADVDLVEAHQHRRVAVEVRAS